MRRLSVQAARRHHPGGPPCRVYYSLPPPIRLCPSRSFVACSKRCSDKKHDITVRQFEQSSPTSKERIEIDPEAEEENQQKELRQQIAQLERELDELKDGAFGPNGPFMRSLSEEDRAKALEALRKYDEEHPEEKVREEREAEEDRKEEEAVDTQIEKLIESEFGGMAKEEQDFWDLTKEIKEPEEPPKEAFEVELKVPENRQAYVDRFNKTLKTLRANPTLAQKQDAWRSYKRCKELLPFFVEILPAEALNILWDSQAPQADADRRHRSHLEILAEDILSNGRDLSWPQWIEYLDILYVDGKSDKALPLWKDLKNILGQQEPEDRYRYWELGVKLRLANGELERAQEEAMSFLAADERGDPRLLIPIAVGWAQHPDAKDDSRSWALYLKLKTMLGDKMTMSDYDDLSVGFLKAGKASLALAIFKDMMLTGQNSKAESGTLYKASLGLVGSLHASSISENDVNKISLGALTLLPREFQNKFFYASWIKKLIGMGETDSAAQVVELMYERGLKPDPKHLNGIMGAWLREGSPKSKDKAERLGWAMVQERIDQVWGSQPSRPSVHDPESGAGVAKSAQRRVPPATIETFSILLLYYTRRDREPMVNYLVQCLKHAQVRPNTFFMNHLLYRELRQQNIFGVWSGYKETTSSMRPDLETFACLWDCGKLQYDRTRHQYDSRFPSARELYNEMMGWYTSLTPHHQNRVQEEFSQDLYEQILRCFCLSLDLHGALVALRSLRETFGFSPGESATRVLLFLIVRIAPPPPGTKRFRRQRIASTPRAKENLEHATTLIGVLRDRRIGILKTHGIDFEELDEESQKQFEVEAMCDVLRVILRRLAKNWDIVEEKLSITAEEMGVADLDLGESLDMEV